MAKAKSGIRQYEPVWIKLKEKKQVKLRVAPHLMRRVKKAVIKEKDIDVAYKVQMEATTLVLKFKYILADWQLEIRLIEDTAVRLSDL